MTYLTLVEYIQERIEAHYLINQYGFGNLSDIETPETGAPNYPYAFLRPQDISVGPHSNSFGFELILMDYVFDTTLGHVDGISRMLQILSDIVDDLRTKNRELDIEFSVTSTPFKERFKDNVVGLTARINIITATPLDGCNPVIA